MMMLIGQFLQQAAPQSNDIPATIQGAVALVLLFVAREVPTISKSVIAWVNVRTEERQKKLDMIEQLLKRIDTLEGRADTSDQRADKAADKAEAALASVEEQRSNHDREIGQLNGKYDIMLKQYEEQGVLLQTSVERIQTLQQEKEELAKERDLAVERAVKAERERDELRQTLEPQLDRLTRELDTLNGKVKGYQERLAEYETGSHPVVTLPADAPSPDNPAGELPSSSKLPGLPFS